MARGKSIGIWIPVLLLLFAGGEAQTIRSDFDESGSVDFSDFVLFAQAFGKPETRFDLDGNGSVDLADFLLFAADFARSVPADASSAWQQVEAANAGPGARFDHSLIVDPVRNRLVIFGGRDAQFLNETWIFEIESLTWRQVQTAVAPDARRGHAAIYDAPRRRMVIFAGQQNGFFNDVWAFDLEREVWQKISVSGNLPVPRYGTSAVFDTRRNRMIISHGFSSQGRFDDTWAFDLAQHAWIDLTPSGGEKPAKRCLHDAVYVEAQDRMLLFGGCSSGFGPCPQDDLWAFDLIRLEWRQIRPSGDVPTARGNPGLTYDVEGKQTLLVGGKAPLLAENDVWRFDAEAETWEIFSVQGSLPKGRWSHGAEIDAASKRLFVFGGTNGVERFDDLWAFSF